MDAARVVRAREFPAACSKRAFPLAAIDGVTARLHGADMPYRWHANDGAEVFAVLDGVVDMHYRAGGENRSRSGT